MRVYPYPYPEPEESMPALPDTEWSEYAEHIDAVEFLTDDYLP